MEKAMSDYAELVLRLENHGAFFTKIAKSHEPIDKEEALEDAAVYFDAALAIVTLRTERDAAQQAISDYALRTSMKVEGVSREDNDRACFQDLMKHGRDRSPAYTQTNGSDKADEAS